MIGQTIFLVWIQSSMLLQSSGQGQLASDQCITSLELPAYPRLAVLSRVSGSGVATVMIGEKGNPKSIEISHLPPLLEREVRNRLQESRFALTCRAKSVRLIFTFALVGAPT